MIKYWWFEEDEVYVEGDEGMRERERMACFVACSSGGYRWNPLGLPAAAASHLYKIWIWCLTGTVCSVAWKKSLKPGPEEFL